MIDIVRASRISGFMSEANLTWFAEQAQMRQRIVEVGAFCGRTTRALCDHAPGFVWTVDDWRGSRQEPDAVDASLALHGREAVKAMFEAHLQDHLDTGKLRVLEMTSVEAAEILRWGYGPQYADMIVVDASHDYVSVKADIAAWLPLLAPGGLFCGDDFGFAGVQQAVHEAFGAVELVNNWLWVAQIRDDGTPY